MIAPKLLHGEVYMGCFDNKQDNPSPNAAES